MKNNARRATKADSTDEDFLEELNSKVKDGSLKMVMLPDNFEIPDNHRAEIGIAPQWIYEAMESTCKIYLGDQQSQKTCRSTDDLLETLVAFARKWGITPNFSKQLDIEQCAKCGSDIDTHHAHYALDIRMINEVLNQADPNLYWVTARFCHICLEPPSDDQIVIVPASTEEPTTWARTH